jgi:hypothetical protein
MAAKGPPLHNTPECSTLHWRRGASDEPRTTTGVDTLRRARRMEKWVVRGNVLGSRGCPSKETGLKCQFALFKLPYWEVSVVVLWSSIVLTT